MIINAFILRYSSGQDCVAHVIKTHHEDLVKGPLKCPCKICVSDEEFPDILHLYNHLVTVHKLPFAGVQHKTADGGFATLKSLDDLFGRPKKSAKQKRKACSPSVSRFGLSLHSLTWSVLSRLALQEYHNNQQETQREHSSLNPVECPLSNFFV